MYGLFPENKGDYIKKPMQDCTGREMCEEWLYHIGAPIKDIPKLSQESSMHAVPCMMPYITAFFMPRKKIDRPLVVPKHAKNFAFIGQFAETERDCIFTTEYSVRTAMEATYQLLDIDRGIPEVFGSCYDVRYLLNSANVITDGKTVEDLFFFPRVMIK
ncbi:hypothetical protein FACS1894166_05730 [Bacilli bacterium]|nr:hypothetical protein FACS1894166_05730 [Bacilli bacterium]